jgi:hypothetical protein
LIGMSTDTGAVLLRRWLVQRHPNERGNTSK